MRCLGCEKRNRGSCNRPCCESGIGHGRRALPPLPHSSPGRARIPAVPHSAARIVARFCRLAASSAFPSPCLCFPVCGGRRTNRTLRLRTAARTAASLFGRFGASLFGMFGASLFGNLPNFQTFQTFQTSQTFQTFALSRAAPPPADSRRGRRIHPRSGVRCSGRNTVTVASRPASRRLRRPCRSVGLWPRGAPSPPGRSDGTWRFPRFADAKHFAAHGAAGVCALPPAAAFVAGSGADSSRAAFRRQPHFAAHGAAGVCALPLVAAFFAGSGADSSRAVPIVPIVPAPPRPRSRVAVFRLWRKCKGRGSVRVELIDIVSLA